ncbi:MAG: YbjN domain-containing protein [Kaiparowitsia implicata GSE-PSE-MK54-09C]|nr:YbjN domain-containing protein [Kaiparowitsia implicata GSE-PSE-MK54-09C]
MCQVSSADYQIIVASALFNLKPAVRSPLTNGEFQPDRPIQLELALKPELLPRLLEHASTGEEALEYLVKLSEEHEGRLGSGGAGEQESGGAGELGSGGVGEQGSGGDGEQEVGFEIDPLLQTESWLCLSVTQEKDNGETTGYRTLWSYVTPAALAEGIPDQEKLTEGITQFFADLVGHQLDPIAQAFASDTVGVVSRFFKELAEADPHEIFGNDDNEFPTVFAAMLDFFTKDDWSFLRIQGEPALRLAFEGQNGSWNCYAKAREDAGQIVFYSLCPLAAPDDKRPAVAEFITRANYGMVLGNFELDFEDGEIRYKTSAVLEAGGQRGRGAEAVIREIVYTNVMIMDEYLPGIQAILETDQTPQSAIQVIEDREVADDASRGAEGQGSGGAGERRGRGAGRVNSLYE